MSTAGSTLDPNTPVGQFRVLAGDAAQDAEGNYALFSDADIRVYLEQYPDNIYRAISIGYMALAAAASTQSKWVIDYDLQVDLRQRAKEMRASADQFRDRADEYDAENLNSGDFFNLIDPQPPVIRGYYGKEAAPGASLW